MTNNKRYTVALRTNELFYRKDHTAQGPYYGASPTWVTGSNP